MDWQTRYTKAGDLHIAYQVAGDGPLNVVVAPPIVSHLELVHEFPGYERWLDRLTRFAKVAVYDKRGQGLSDRPDHASLLEERVDDIRAVLDACEMSQAAIIGVSEGGAASLLFTAMYPEAVSALVLCGASAVYAGDPAEGAFITSEVAEAGVTAWVEMWGAGAFMSMLAPSLVGTPSDHLLGKMERFGSSVGAIADVMHMLMLADVRSVLPAIRVPTLVVRRSDEIAPEHSSRKLVEGIAGAEYLDVPGTDHLPWVGDVDGYVDMIEEFLTGRPAVPRDDIDRVLTTVLFTDIVESTAQAASMGDRSWHRVLDQHDDMVRAQVERHRGRLVNTTGDGALAEFDGPARAIRCAVALNRAAGQLGLSVRSGIHTGECERRGDDLAGIAVHIGARVSTMAAGGEVLVTKTVRDLVVGSEFKFDHRGSHELKGVPGDWEVLAVADG